MSYEDIINFPHPTSKKHPRMSLYDRAAQFSPFAALTGHEAAILETARLTECNRELDDDEKEKINEKLQMIRQHLGEQLEVTITYFVPDQRKEGGSYVTHIGVVKRIHQFDQVVIMRDELVIPIGDIRKIEIDDSYKDIVTLFSAD